MVKNELCSKSLKELYSWILEVDVAMFFVLFAVTIKEIHGCYLCLLLH